MFTQKSFVLKPADANKKWFLVDGENQIVGRLATEVADLLRGKNNPCYTPNVDSGDYVVIVNAEKIKLTGNKIDKKLYYWHSNFIGGLKQRTAKEQLVKNPQKVIMEAVKGMLPKNALGKKQLKKLKLVVGSEHTYQAQKPEVYKIKEG
ncbi:MAG: 50S ribosomal protein L13 [Bdellovibrionales bacterium RIFOXYB1_FULL_37_110]|nr:MAG: 50S ribosomal protein L13 [Bdellovibrionales bacterium RIFOXYA1_FULL_38_20]OFZ51145.1 MAG: 50S ribosomal protein L13 [Bdellovibrionales bacterium RIFOXYC1_FULL_37_79]OFZ61251.1 MAG: 50S ribosomal protein L13 [Bdellovibrionales bacterium RIFOXYB1_FULL_37_110]OFZ62114.1 MAG: 50S ribosomal protein L13 [Bdellovibrionales bacterium RIFOXYD1_FULL_36_51]